MSIALKRERCNFFGITFVYELKSDVKGMHPIRHPVVPRTVIYSIIYNKKL